MKTQNYENHRQSDRWRMYIAFMLLIVSLFFGYMLIGDAVNGLKNPWFHWTYAIGYLLPALALLACRVAVLKLRMYATKLQDRIIWQEVNFRYYVATGTTLPGSITIPQIVALRFAGDDEFVALVDQIIKNPSLSNKEIKKMIKNRKWDYSRV